MCYSDTVTDDAPQAPTPHAPQQVPSTMRIDAAVGLQAMPDGSVTVSLGWGVAGWATTTVLLPLDSAELLGTQLQEAARKARNPLITGPEVAQLIGRLPRNEH